MNGCGNVNSKPVSKDLLDYFSLRDDNNNGVLENGSEIPEGHVVADADLDGDGKVIGAELRYFAHFVLQSRDQSLLAANPITPEDREVLLCLFQKRVQNLKEIKDPNEKTEKLRKTACEIMNVFKDSTFAAQVFQSAIEAAEKGTSAEGFGGAMIEADAVIASSLLRIGESMAKVGLGTEAAGKVFALAVDHLKKVKDPQIKGVGYGVVASTMVKAKLPLTEAQPVFQLGLDTANAMRDVESKEALLSTLRRAMRRVGLD